MNDQSTKEIFTIDAENIEFANNENNPTRELFKRMIDQLDHIRSNDDWVVIIKMHPDLWVYISYLYSFGSYYESDRNVCFTEYNCISKDRHREYLEQCALPISGRLCQVVLDNSIEPSSIYFVNEFFWGHIKNVDCIK